MLPDDQMQRLNEKIEDIKALAQFASSVTIIPGETDRSFLRHGRMREVIFQFDTGAEDWDMFLFLFREIIASRQPKQALPEKEPERELVTSSYEFLSYRE